MGINEPLHPQEHKETKETHAVSAQTSGNNRYARTFKNERPAVQVALFVLWRIHNKKYTIGSRLFANEIEETLGTNKTNYKEALLFLEGAGAVMNEVVIANTVSKDIIERYGLAHE